MSPSGPDDGLARLLRWRDEAQGVPPAVRRLGAVLETVARGSTSVRLPLRAELLTPAGQVSAGLAALVADVGLTTAVVTTLPSPQAVTTIAMTVDLVGAVPADGTLLATCDAEPYAEGGPQHATGLVRDAAGRRVAVVSGWFLPATIDPSGTAGQDEREPDARDLVDLLGLDPVPDVGAGEGGTAARLHARPCLTNASGTLHGGVGALACLLTAEAALGTRTQVLTTALGYLRPTPRGGEVLVRTRLVRRGRRTGTAVSELVAPDGRVALQATVVAAVG